MSEKKPSDTAQGGPVKPEADARREGENAANGGPPTVEQLQAEVAQWKAKADERLELKRLYRVLFRSGQKMSVAMAAARKEFTSVGARTMLEFVASSQRGICADTRTPEGEETQDELKP